MGDGKKLSSVQLVHVQCIQETVWIDFKVPTEYRSNPAVYFTLLLLSYKQHLDTINKTIFGLYVHVVAFL